MFSLQTIFGSGQQFFSLLDESAAAAHESAKALHTMMLSLIHISHQRRSQTALRAAQAAA